MRIKISNIEWDVSDGYDGSDLPHYEEMDLTEAIGELVDEILSDQYGYPVMSLEIEAMDDTEADMKYHYAHAQRAVNMIVTGRFL